jgi:hypothetical protein
MDESCGPATRGIVVPSLPALPLWLQCSHWKAKSHHLRHEFGEFLQPAPEPPLKPPHARFHPVPTQPVFSARAGYIAPQLVGVHPPADPHVEHLPSRPLSEQFDEIPVPIPDVPPAQPIQPVPDPLSSPPAETEPLPQNNDALRGPIGRVQFLSAEPNPLR